MLSFAVLLAAISVAFAQQTVSFLVHPPPVLQHTHSMNRNGDNVVESDGVCRLRAHWLHYLTSEFSGTYYLRFW